MMEEEDGIESSRFIFAHVATAAQYLRASPEKLTTYAQANAQIPGTVL